MAKYTINLCRNTILQACGQLVKSLVERLEQFDDSILGLIDWDKTLLQMMTMMRHWNIGCLIKKALFGRSNDRLKNIVGYDKKG